MNLLHTITVNLLQISVTLCGQLQRDVFPKDILQRQLSQPYSDGDTTNTHAPSTQTLSNQLNLAQIILSVFYILTDTVNHIFKNLTH
jgi:hypothetical protein